MFKNKKFPELVTKLITFCDAWIVGGAAFEDKPKDYDIFVPFKFWQLASSYIPKNSKINRMGGFKCLSDGEEVDAWTGDMNDFCKAIIFLSCYQPKYGILIKRENVES